MAFMMPVMKNDWDIYKSNRSRRTSEGSGSHSHSGRSRKVSESKSESCGGSAGTSPASPAHRSVPALLGRGAPSDRSRPPRPARSLSCSPPAPASSPPEKFHTRLVDKLKRTLLRKDRSVGSTEDERSS